MSWLAVLVIVVAAGWILLLALCDAAARGDRTPKRRCADVDCDLCRGEQ